MDDYAECAHLRTIMARFVALQNELDEVMEERNVEITVLMDRRVHQDAICEATDLQRERLRRIREAQHKKRQARAG